MTRNENTANQALYEAAQHRAKVARALSGSSIVTRQRHQRSVVKKQQNTLLTFAGYAVLLSSSALVGVLLAS